MPTPNQHPIRLHSRRSLVALMLVTLMLAACSDEATLTGPDEADAPITTAPPETLPATAAKAPKACGNVIIRSQVGLSRFDCDIVLGTLYIAQNPGVVPIVDLRPLGRVQHIFGGLVIKGTELTSLTGLENLASVGEHLQVYGNPTLSSCSSHLSGLIDLDWKGDPYFRGVGGNLRIEWNASGCNSPQQVLDNHIAQ